MIQLKILFYFAQITSLIVPRDKLNATFEALNFRPSATTGAFGGVCIAPFSTLDKYSLQLANPVILLGFLFAIVLIVRFAERWRSQSRTRRLSQLAAINSDAFDSDGEAKSLLADDNERNFADNDDDEMGEEDEKSLNELRFRRRQSSHSSLNVDMEDTQSEDFDSAVSIGLSGIGKNFKRPKKDATSISLPFSSWLRFGRTAVALVNSFLKYIFCF